MAKEFFVNFPVELDCQVGDCLGLKLKVDKDVAVLTRVIVVSIFEVSCDSRPAVCLRLDYSEVLLGQRLLGLMVILDYPNCHLRQGSGPSKEEAGHSKEETMLAF